MGRETDVVKSFTLKGQARTEAVARALKDVQTGTERAGKSAGQASGHFTSLAGRMESMNRTMEGARRSLDNFTKFLGAAGLVGAAVGAVRSFDQMVTATQRYQDVMGNLPFGIQKAKEATAGFVGQMDLAKAASLATRSGLATTGEGFAELSGAAVRLGRALGLDASQALEQLTGFLAEGKLASLDNFGIIVDSEAAYREYAASIGKTAGELTELEKTTAAQQAGLEALLAATKDLHLETDSATATWIRWKTEMQSWTEDVIPGVIGMFGALTDAIAGVGDEVERTQLRGMAGIEAELLAQGKGLEDPFLQAQSEKRLAEREAAEAMARADAREQELADLGMGPALPPTERRGGGRGRGGRQAGPAEDVNRRLDFGFERETEASLQEELFEQELAIIERRKEATEAWFERDHELHQQRLRWMEEEVAARERSAARIMAITDFAANESIANANRVAELTAIAQQAGMLSAEKAAGVQAWLGGFEAAVIAASEAVKAAASFASQNYVQGAAHVAASAFAAVKSALLFGQAASLGAGGGGLHVGAGGDFNFGQGVGPSANDGGPVTPRGPNTDTPTSQGGGPVGPPGGGARPGQRTVVVNLSGVVGDKADVGKFVKEAVLAADQKYGT